jgi:hypothetical protein
MMRRIYFVSLVIIILILYGTDDSVLSGAGITPQLKLFDTDGNEKTTFKRGENFEIRFSFTNSTGKDLTYHYTGVPVIFEIFRDDAYVCSSADGLVVAQVFLTKTLRNGETFQDIWLAPNTVGTIPRERKIFLSAGNYKALVEYRFVFDNFSLEKTPPVTFKIIR